MKVLKSGIEMTPAQLKKMKGGACACGCDYSAEGLWLSGKSGSSCECGCIGKGDISAGDIFRGGATTALTYL